MIFPRWEGKRLKLIARATGDTSQAEAILRRARDRVKYVTGIPVAAGIAGGGVLCLSVMTLPFLLDNRDGLRLVMTVLQVALNLCIPYLLYTGIWLLLKANSISAALRVGSFLRTKPVDEETVSRQTPFGVRMLGVALILSSLSIAYERLPRPKWLHLPPTAERLLDAYLKA